uniref:CCHC-type domain-containing protein n=1 Tax=Trichogramma kaykai TaxID=54128 RepID=A0ABD2W898_9HYME
MSAGLLDLQALSKSSEPLENTPMSTWLRSSRPSSPAMVVPPPSAADITKRIVEAPAMAKDAPVPSLKEFSSGDLDEKLARLEGLMRGLADYVKHRKKPAVAEIFLLPHSGVRSTTAINGVLGSALLEAGRGGCIHTVLDKEKATRNVAAAAKRATGPHPHEHEQVVDANNNASAKEETFTIVKGRRGRRRADHQAVVAERGSQPPGPRQRKVRVIRRSASGAMVLQLRKGVQNASALGTELDGVLGEADTARALGHKTALEIRDLDECATKEICTALCHQLGMANPVPDAVRSLRKAYAGTQTAVIDLPDELAAKALKLGRLRVGWVSCRVRERAEASRCFRCWEFDHVAARCVGPDRSKLCYRCGQDGHRAKTCRSEPVCLLCQGPDASGHATISPSCPLAKKHLSSRR